MPPKPSPVARTSLYRLVNVPQLRDAVRGKYLTHEGFTTRGVTVGEREALLVVGSMATETVSWANTLQGLTSETIDLGNLTAAAVLIIRNGDKNAWGLSYGMGFQLLEQTKLDAGFGQRIAIRVADPMELNSVTRTTLDQRSRTDRFSIPSGDHLRGFGVGDFGELVTRLVAKAKIPTITGGETPTRLRGADALSIPLAREPTALLTDLNELEGILAKPAAPELEVLEQLVAIKHDPELVDILETALQNALANPTDARLGLSWPHERIDENGTLASFHIRGAGRGHNDIYDGVPELNNLLVPLEGEADPLNRLKRMKIQLYRDNAGEEPISGAIPGLKWIAFETEQKGRRYCLHDGSWYLMDQQYADKLKRQAQAIFDRGPGVKLPEWPPGMDEGQYNALVAESLNGTLLDRQLIRTSLHRRGIEACDVLASDGSLVHVKSVESSSPASHLLSQALVSTDALLYDEEARKMFRDQVEKRGGNTKHIPDPVRSVVLGIARKGRAVRSDDLFTFTQVTLVRHVAALEGRGVNVFVSPIIRPE